MATVIGKQSAFIDALLAPLITGAQIVDGNLILTTKANGTILVGGVGGSNAVSRQIYKNGAYPTRPTGTLCVEWIGPTQPPQMTSDDTWVSTA